MIRTYKFRLYPTKTQETAMVTLLDRLRYFYNAAMQERREGYKRGVKVTRWSQSASIAVIRNDPECAEYASVTGHLMQDALKRLEQTFQAFFRRVKTGAKAGYPRFKGRDRYNTFVYQDAGRDRGVKVVAGGARLRLCNIGNVKMKAHQKMEGALKTIGVRRDKCGHWYALITRDVAAKPLPATGESVGIDVGLTTFAALSDGTMVANPRPLATARIRIERTQRKVSRRKRGSKRRRKARVLLAKAHAHIASVRKDFHHKTARAIVSKNDSIAIEDLDFTALANGRFRKYVRDAGWGQFVTILTEKAEEAARILVRVDPRGTSQECSECGTKVVKALRVRIHECPACGLRMDRDMNAARNIHDRAFAVTEPGQGFRREALQRQTSMTREVGAL